MVGVCAFGLGAFSAFFPRACFEIYLGETAGWSGFVDIHDFFFLYSFIPFSLRPSFGPPSDVLLAPEPAKTEAPEAVNTHPSSHPKSGFRNGRVHSAVAHLLCAVQQTISSLGASKTCQRPARLGIFGLECFLFWA